MEGSFWFPDDPWCDAWCDEKILLEKEKRKNQYWSISWKEKAHILYGNDYEILMYHDWIEYAQKVAPEFALLESLPFGARFLVLSDMICDILSQEGAVYDWRQRVWRKRRNSLY